ncbi:MAG: FAD-dependent monooxygenase [Actinobacteria bacterium]|jgi:2-polyprenyl-6-methoxyphenol hydroxylase-like FAD-dependent oxidoreductase|nr:FAD-dependent monooxygenase [Actinomycetota bacterium]NBP91681.1 FAD-dependent monooxygenase [Actinomycetota bacterium]
MSELGEIIDTDIVIVGGGVAGSALAAALRNSGHRLVVIDQRTGPIDTSRGDHFSPVNVEAFAEWGILDGFFAKGATKRIGHEFRTSSGEVLISAEYTELGIKYPYFLVYHHDLMAETFQEFAAESKNYQLFQPYAAKSFDIEGGSIKSVTAVSPDGKSITVRAHLVIASDGAASPIRAALRFPTFEHPYRRTMVAFFATRPAALAPEDYFFRYSDPSGVLVIQQRNDGQIKVTMPIGDEGVPWWKVSSAEQRAEVLGERAHILRGVETQIGGFYPVRMIHALQYVSGNTVLVGDAAHAIHPARGQGLNMGIGALPELLKHIPTPADISNPAKVAAGLLAYEQVQKPKYERVMARNHAAAMDMELSADENHEFFLKRQDESIRKMALIPEARRLHLLEGTGYHFGVPGVDEVEF